jgi:hypothetical protein
MKPPAKFTEPFHILLSADQKTRALALANMRGISIGELFRNVLEKELLSNAADAAPEGKRGRGKRPADERKLKSDKR